MKFKECIFGFLAVFIAMLLFGLSQDHYANAADGDVAASNSTTAISVLHKSDVNPLSIDVTMPSDYSASQGGVAVTLADVKTATKFNTVTAIYCGFYGTGLYWCCPTDDLHTGSDDGYVFIVDPATGAELASGDVSASPCQLSVYGYQ